MLSIANNTSRQSYTDWSALVTRVAWEMDSLAVTSPVRVIKSQSNHVETGAGLGWD